MSFVYVAGGSSERLTVVRHWIAQLHAQGISQSHDWTLCPSYDRPSTEEEKRRWAREDLDGVRRASLVWVLSPDAPSEGAATELGYALALGKTVFVSGMHASRESRIFYLCAAANFATHDIAFRVICKEILQGGGNFITHGQGPIHP